MDNIRNLDHNYSLQISLIVSELEFILCFSDKKTIYSMNKKTKDFNIITEDLHSDSKNKLLIYGIIGIIKAINHEYLIVIKKTELVGFLLRNEIYLITEVDFIPFIPQVESKIFQEDELSIKMFLDNFKRNNLYYSKNYDLTRNINHFTRFDTIENSFQNYRKEYCWNYKLFEKFNIPDLFKVYLINGFIDIMQIDVYQKVFNYIIISRKDMRRPSIRFIRRGADDLGNCANFIESEEILILEETDTFLISSYILLSGSIPLKWNQTRDLSMNPKISLTENKEIQISIFRNHFLKISNEYLRILIINLCDKRNQKILSNEYESVFKSVSKEKEFSNIGFVWFDYNTETKNGKNENISKLLRHKVMENNKDFFDSTIVSVKSNFSFGKYMKNEFKINRIQSGFFRINCLDCLDRTNIVKSFLSRQVIRRFLNDRLNIIDNNNNANEKFCKILEEHFLKKWCNNGNALSISYSGTKTSTSYELRYGKKSFIHSLIIQLKRWFYANFYDGYYQDCLDFSLGLFGNDLNNLAVRKNHYYLISIAIIYVFLVCLWFRFTINIAFDSPIELGIRKAILLLLIFFCIVIISFKLVIINLRTFILDNPTLNELKNKIF